MKKLFNIYDRDEEILHKTALMKFTNLPTDYITFQDVLFQDHSDEFVHVTIVDDPNFENKVSSTLTLGDYCNVSWTDRILHCLL
jgi:hypothetical protein